MVLFQITQINTAVLGQELPRMPRLINWNHSITPESTSDLTCMLTILSCAPLSQGPGQRQRLPFTVHSWRSNGSLDFAYLQRRLLVADAHPQPPESDSCSGANSQHLGRLRHDIRRLLSGPVIANVLCRQILATTLPTPCHSFGSAPTPVPYTLPTREPMPLISTMIDTLAPTCRVAFNPQPGQPGLACSTIASSRDKWPISSKSSKCPHVPSVSVYQQATPAYREFSSKADASSDL